MAIEQVIGGLYIPRLESTIITATEYLLDNAPLRKIAFVFICPATGTLDKIEFLTGAVGQAPANGLKVSFQNVSGGLPDGTIDQYRVISGITANTWLVPGLMTSDGTDGGVKRSVVRGDILCAVIEFASFNVLDSVNVKTVGTFSNMSYLATETLATSWSKEAVDEPNMALKYSDGRYLEPIVINTIFSEFVIIDFDSSTTPDEVGMVFSFSTNVRIGGVFFNGFLGGSTDFVLYDGDTNLAIATLNFSSEEVFASNSVQVYTLPSDLLLLANHVYRLTIKPLTAATMTAYGFKVPSTAIMDSLPGGSRWSYCERTNGGTFVDDPLKRIQAGVIVTGMEHEISGNTGGPGWEGEP